MRITIYPNKIESDIKQNRLRVEIDISDDSICDVVHEFSTDDVLDSYSKETLIEYMNDKGYFD